MRTIFGVFLLALIGSLLLTPGVAKLAAYFNLLDHPSMRKVHSQPMPRVGGVAIFLSFFGAFGSIFFLNNVVEGLLRNEPRLVGLVLGALVAFGVGFIDDIRGLTAKTKFFVQILSALVAYVGGIHITVIGLPGITAWQLGWLSLPVTVFWIILVINAINLIDGLDGLAAGVSFLVAMVLFILCLSSNNMLGAIIMAGLGGAVLGFLRYNFNPASVFMGDSGSYFLGYMIATLSVLTSIKVQTAATLLIPVVALGLPLTDTLLVAMRRFIVGEKIFSADQGHLHHRLLWQGYSHRRAVFLLYGITVGLGLIAVFMVYVYDVRASLLLLLMAVGLFLGVRHLGYLKSFDQESLLGWAMDVFDEIGLRRDRRIFLANQLAIFQAKDLGQLWQETIAAGQRIEVDHMEMNLSAKVKDFSDQRTYCWHRDPKGDVGVGPDKGQGLYLRVPLEDNDRHFGLLIVAKDMSSSSQMTAQTLRRVEHLRRTVSRTLSKLREMGEIDGEKT